MIQRKLGNAYVRLSELQSSANNETDCLRKASDYYANLCSKEYHSVEDLINLGKIYRILASKYNLSDYYQKSIDVLKASVQEYSHDYRTYMQIALTYYANNDNNNSIEYCRLAMNHYTPTDASGFEENDEDTEQFKKIYKQYFG